MAIQKLNLVRNFAHQDTDPCWVLDGLYLGETFPHISFSQQICITSEPTIAPVNLSNCAAADNHACRLA